jgi:hypothetical protein
MVTNCVVIENIYNIMLNILMVEGRVIKSTVGMKLQNWISQFKNNYEYPIYH